MTKQDKKKEATDMKDNKKNKKQKLINHEEEINILKQEVVDLKDHYLRTVADSENLRKRLEKETNDARKFALSGFAKDLIDVIENLYRSIEHITDDLKQNKDVKKIFEGVELTQNEFIKVLNKYDVERILPKTGDKFDHNLHQAISTLKDNKNPTDTIINIIQAGYQLKDRLLRPALVVVSAKE